MVFGCGHGRKPPLWLAHTDAGWSGNDPPTPNRSYFWAGARDDNSKGKEQKQRKMQLKSGDFHWPGRRRAKAAPKCAGDRGRTRLAAARRVGLTFCLMFRIYKTVLKLANGARTKCERDGRIGGGRGCERDGDVDVG